MLTPTGLSAAAFTVVQRFAKADFSERLSIRIEGRCGRRAVQTLNRFSGENISLAMLLTELDDQSLNGTARRNDDLIGFFQRLTDHPAAHSGNVDSWPSLFDDFVAACRRRHSIGLWAGREWSLMSRRELHWRRNC